MLKKSLQHFLHFCKCLQRKASISHSCWIVTVDFCQEGRLGSHVKRHCMNWSHTEQRPYCWLIEVKPLMRPLVLVSELCCTGSPRGCQCLHSKVGQRFPVCQRRDFVNSAWKLCPHESKPHVAGAVINSRLSSGQRQSHTAYFYTQGGRTRQEKHRASLPPCALPSWFQTGRGARKIWAGRPQYGKQPGHRTPCHPLLPKSQGLLAGPVFSKH